MAEDGRDERIEEIKAISPIRPARRVALINPRRGRRELRYQMTRYRRADKPKSLKPERLKQGNLLPESVKPAGAKAAGVQPARKKGLGDSRGIGSGSAIASNGADSLARYKKRVAYDRTVILGE